MPKINKRVVLLIFFVVLLSLVSIQGLSMTPAKKIAELGIISRAYGSSTGSEKWDSDADLNSDGRVDIYDVALSIGYPTKKKEIGITYTTEEPSPPIISVNPENTLVDLPGDNFSIDVNVTNAQNTWAFEFQMDWNPSILNITSVTNGSFLSQGGELYCANDTQYDDGFVMFACTLLEPATSQSDNGTLAIIDFTALDVGNTELNLSNTKLLNDNLENYTHEKSDGNVKVGLITLISPQNATYTSQIIDLHYTIGFHPVWTGYSLDGKIRDLPIYLVCSSTDGLADCETRFVTSGGPHKIIIFAEDDSGQMHRSEIRYFSVKISGGCPHLYTWNGTEYVLENNLLPFSDNPNRPEFVVEDYYKLEKPLVKDNGKYSLMIAEFEQEHSYFDQVQLLAIDHDSSFKIAPSPSGEILTYKNPVPGFAYDNKFDDLTFALNTIDGDYFEGHKDDFIILNFGKVEANNGKLIMKSDWRPPFPVHMKWSVHVQVLKDGEWEEVAIVIPRNYWADDAVDLSDYLTDEDLVVRLYFTSTHKIDFVGLDTSEPEEFDVLQGNLVTAIHSEDGNVKQKLVRIDETYAELIPGQNIKIDFTLPDGNKEVRDYILYSKGHYYRIG